MTSEQKQQTDCDEPDIYDAVAELREHHMPERIWIAPTTLKNRNGRIYIAPGRRDNEVEYIRADLQQVAPTCLHCNKPIRLVGSAWLHVEIGLATCRREKSNQHDGIYRAEPATKESITNDAATSMRSACVEKVKALRDEWQRKHQTLNTDAELVDRLCLEGDVRVANTIITALESVSIQEQEK